MILRMQGRQEKTARRQINEAMYNNNSKNTPMNAITQQQPHHPTFYVFLFFMYI